MCNFIVIVQRKQPLQNLAAVQVVLFITRDKIMSLWSALGCHWQCGCHSPRDTDNLRAHLVLMRISYTGYLHLHPVSQTQTEQGTALCMRSREE